MSGGWEHPPAMSLGRLLRRASSRASDLLTLTPGAGGPPSILDGEIIYSKNNVCVHPPEGLQGLGEHHPGEREEGRRRGGEGGGERRGEKGRGRGGEERGAGVQACRVVSEAPVSLPHLSSPSPCGHLPSDGTGVLGAGEVWAQV